MKANRRAQVSIEFLIVLAAAISFLVVFLTATGNVSNKALDRSELQTQKTAFNDLVYFSNYANGNALGVTFKAQIFLVDDVEVKTNQEGTVLSMQFKTTNGTYLFENALLGNIILTFDKLEKGTRYLEFTRNANAVTITIQK